MYYKEEIINGRLCWKSSPNGKWNEFSQKDLTEKIVKLQEKIDNLLQQLNKN